jgi:hypothetical protein
MPSPAAVASAPSAETPAKKAGTVGLFFDPNKLYPPSRAKETILTVQTIEGDGNAAKLVTKNIQLHQGLNLVKAPQVALVEEHYADLISRGAVEIVELGDTVGTGAANVLNNLSALSDSQAIKAAGYERDRAVLNGWLTNEPRPAVVRAINGRITALEKGASL